MKAVVLATFNQEKALVGAFSVITNLRMQFGCNFLKHYWAPLHSREILTLARAGGLFESKSCDSLLEPDTDVETEAEDGVTCHETSGHVTCHETSGHVTCHDTSGHLSLLPAEGRDCSGQQYKAAPTYCR